MFSVRYHASGTRRRWWDQQHTHATYINTYTTRRVFLSGHIHKYVHTHAHYALSVACVHTPIKHEPHSSCTLPLFYLYNNIIVSPLLAPPLFGIKAEQRVRVCFVHDGRMTGTRALAFRVLMLVVVVVYVVVFFMLLFFFLTCAFGVYYSRFCTRNVRARRTPTDDDLTSISQSI